MARGWYRFWFIGFWYGSLLCLRLRVKTYYGLRRLPTTIARIAVWRDLKDVVISDQNLFQTISSLVIRNLVWEDPRLVADGLAVVPREFLPDVVIHVRAAPQTIADRRKRYRGGGSEAFETKIRGKARIEEFINAMNLTRDEEKPLRYMELQNEGDACIHDLAQLVIEGIFVDVGGVKKGRGQ